MAISKNQAKELTTKDEQVLVESSFHPVIRELSEARLRQKVSRTRRLRDKYTDLLRRQTDSSKRRGRGGGDDNQRTRRKAQLFGQTLERFEARLQVLLAPPPPPQRQPSAAAPAAKTVTPTGPRPGKAPKHSAPQRADKFEVSRGKAHQAHTSSAGRRHQGKRDKR